MLRKNRELRQTSETFLLSAILALSGGFQDAYTYNARDEVFSNAQTGNVVLMSQHLMMGDFKIALRYLFPLIAFALGVLYLIGTVWFCVQAGKTASAALAICVYPFIPLDIVKMVIVVLIGPMISSRLKKAHLNV